MGTQNAAVLSLLYEEQEGYEEDNGPVGFDIEVLVPVGLELLKLGLPEKYAGMALALVMSILAKMEKDAKANRARLRLASK